MLFAEAGLVYDDLGRLKDVYYPNQEVHYTYDAAGNRTAVVVQGGGLAADPDGDGLNNQGEIAAGTGLADPDSDDDTLPDGWEVNNTLNPLDAADAGLDPDGDRLTNVQEYAAGTLAQDTDTDNDTLSDNWEVRYGLAPTNAADAGQDAEPDGLTNVQEYGARTDPHRTDSDGDGVNDASDPAPAFNPAWVSPLWLIIES